MVKYFDWLKKQPANQVPSIELTIMYSGIVVSCGCHRTPVLHNIAVYLYLLFGRCHELVGRYQGSWIIKGCILRGGEGGGGVSMPTYLVGANVYHLSRCGS